MSAITTQSCRRAHISVPRPWSFGEEQEIRVGLVSGMDCGAAGMGRFVGVWGSGVEGEALQVVKTIGWSGRDWIEWLRDALSGREMEE